MATVDVVDKEPRMSGDRITVDDVLARQGSAEELRVTIEAVPEDEGRVKVTPFVPDVGCLCAYSLTIDKQVIESVTTTDEFHHCCGKRLMIVQVSFAENALADVFQQLGDSARRSARPAATRSLQTTTTRRFDPPPTRFPFAQPPDPDPKLWPPRGTPTGSSFHMALCRRSWAECIRGCHGNPYDTHDPYQYDYCYCNCDYFYQVCLDPAHAGPNDCVYMGPT
ncbi:hypothetical protein GCM10023170_049450 [Phytohabitans houttuyneae]|uniref:Uncharacterized protein n=1 Tax=Phytohabitans houttuyneae TaxID=1076126 RepID=A0A6V8KT51_9ACTN|nr:hypothetical protein Phou_092060 [Phytohabitans houttuyneae]